MLVWKEEYPLGASAPQYWGYAGNTRLYRVYKAVSDAICVQSYLPNSFGTIFADGFFDGKEIAERNFEFWCNQSGLRMI